MSGLTKARLEALERQEEKRRQRNRAMRLFGDRIMAKGGAFVIGEMDIAGTVRPRVAYAGRASTFWWSEVLKRDPQPGRGGAIVRYHGLR